jgi:HSP20 family protein
MVRALTPWATRTPRLFEELEREVPRWMTRLFGPDPELFRGDFDFVPNVNMAETDQAVEVTVDLPGMKPEDIRLEMQDGHLIITGEKQEEKEEKGKKYHRVERRTGTFRRVLPMPTAVNEEQVDAAFKDGVLRVTLQKVPEVQAKTIPIKT